VYLHHFAIFVKSGDPAKPQIEILDNPEYQNDDAPVVGAPGIDGLSDTALGNLFFSMSYALGEPQPWAVTLGLEGLCIVNCYTIDALAGEPPSSVTSAFWQDSVHIRSAAEVVTSGRRLQTLFNARNPEVVSKVAERCLLSQQTTEDAIIELSEQLDLMIRHLEWVNENRGFPVVSMCFYD